MTDFQKRALNLTLLWLGEGLVEKVAYELGGKGPRVLKFMEFLGRTTSLQEEAITRAIGPSYCLWYLEQRNQST